MKYVCVCGYVYDPAVGDPENGVAPGTPWEEVPEDWVCPDCGLGKDSFEAHCSRDFVYRTARTQLMRYFARNASVSSLTWISPRFCAFQSSSFLAMRATPSR